MQHVFTSGTSGQCLEVCWLLEDTKKSLLPLWLKRMKQYGIVPQDCLCTFFSAKRYDKEPNWYIQTIGKYHLQKKIYMRNECWKFITK